MRRWVLRAKELRDLGENLPMNDRCRRIWGSKSMFRFSEMLVASRFSCCHARKNCCCVCEHR